MGLRRYAVIVLLFVFAAAGCASLSESGERYRLSTQDIRDGRLYFALINLKDILRDDPGSPYAPQSAFALGEYYFDNTDYSSALTAFSDYIHRYPKHKGAIFAKLLIYKIMVEFKKGETLGEQESALIAMIRKELFSQPIFLIFYDKKSPRSYKSLFQHSYFVYDYVDKIKVFRDDKIFLELSP